MILAEHQAVVTQKGICRKRTRSFLEDFQDTNESVRLPSLRIATKKNYQKRLPCDIDENNQKLKEKLEKKEDRKDIESISIQK